MMAFKYALTAEEGERIMAGLLARDPAIPKEVRELITSTENPNARAATLTQAGLSRIEIQKLALDEETLARVFEFSSIPDPLKEALYLHPVRKIRSRVRERMATMDPSELSFLSEPSFLMELKAQVDKLLAERPGPLYGYTALEFPVELLNRFPKIILELDFIPDIGNDQPFQTLVKKNLSFELQEKVVNSLFLANVDEFTSETSSSLHGSKREAVLLVARLLDLLAMPEFPPALALKACTQLLEAFNGAFPPGSTFASNLFRRVVEATDLNEVALILKERYILTKEMSWRSNLDLLHEARVKAVEEAFFYKDNFLFTSEGLSGPISAALCLNPNLPRKEALSLLGVLPSSHAAQAILCWVGDMKTSNDYRFLADAIVVSPLLLDHLEFEGRNSLHRSKLASRVKDPAAFLKVLIERSSVQGAISGPGGITDIGWYLYRQVSTLKLDELYELLPWSLVGHTNKTLDFLEEELRTTPQAWDIVWALFESFEGSLRDMVNVCQGLD